MNDVLYICSVCKKYKTEKEFSKCNKNKHRNFLNYTCKECYKRIYGKNRKQIEEADTLNEILKIRLHDAKVRAKKKNLFINLTLNYLKELWNTQNGRCALTNFPMTCNLYNGKRNPYNISIDRINPDKGYEIGNVQLVCSSVNMMKGELTIKELKNFCQAIINNI